MLSGLSYGKLDEMFGFFKARRRKRLIETALVSGSLWERAVQNSRALRTLPADDIRRLRELATIFLAEKEFLPVRGAVCADGVKVLISAQACLPILNLGMSWYDGWSSIILTPREYRVDNREVDESGVVHEYRDEVSGEVLELGPVIFSLEDIQNAGGGYNVVIHEMAHKLDGRNGAFDGMPPLPDRAQAAAWRKSFGGAFEKLRNAGSGRIKSPLLRRVDSYAAEDPSEFFAVSCEYFFERPHFLLSVFPEVYARLADFFRQDPASRLGGQEGGTNFALRTLPRDSFWK